MLKGSKMSEESRRKMRDAKERRTALGLPGNRLGVRHSPETKALISRRTKERTQRGSSHYAWKGGTKKLKHGDRATPEYRQWRKDVFERDGYTCQVCRVYTGGGDLRAHHIKPYSEYPELRYDVDNGATLCEHHHEEVHEVMREAA